MIKEDTAGNLWVGTNNGLNMLNKQRNKFTRYLHDPNDPESLSNNIITSLLIDKSGIVWVGSGLVGLVKLDPNHKKFYLHQHYPSNNNSLSNNVVTAIYASSKEILWIGTSGGGLNAWDKKTGKFTHYRHNPNDPTSLASDQVNSVLEDRNGNLWVNTGNVLSKLYPKTGKFIHYSRDFPHLSRLGGDYIAFIIEDPEGLLWLGTGNGIKSFDPKTEKIVHYRHDPKNSKGLADHATRSIFADKRGNIWVGHGSVGLSKLNKETGLITQYLPDPNDSTSLSTSVVYSICEDSKGNLWFGTLGGGLCRFDYAKETFITYTKKHGLPDNTIISIVEDLDGNLWMGTRKWLSKFSPSTQTSTNYDAGDFFQSGILTGFRDQNGTLYFGGWQGLTSFNPRKINSNPHIPQVVITQFKLFDKLLPGKEEAKEITLNHNQNFFSFEFSALNFTNSAKNQYAYQLTGIDKDWVYSGNRRLTSYTEIPPGSYTFKVKGSNNDGVWNEKGTSIRIIIRPPWWRTTWAYIFYGLCFIAGVFAIDRIQRRRLIAKEREKAQEKELAQAREIEKANKQLAQQKEELQATLEDLQNTQAQLIQKEKMASLGELTAGIAHEIQNPLNFVNNFSEVNGELIQELQQEIEADNKKQALAVTQDIRENNQKIYEHGKRADAIVKNMLQHARSNSGEKQLTDINNLVDEYLRLSYHGLRAKDKDFNANLITDFDTNLNKVEMVPQELGRVLLNLFNNAFYATQLKKLQLNGQYQPEVK
ncbi:MAG: hypothetical protein M3142_07140, partial [Bacteroidota bacterium]|nr:hypothetical protein [Bacteroidota bacterium]